MAARIRVTAADGRVRAVTQAPQNEPAATLELAAERRMSAINGRPVIEVEVRDRPRWLRCTLAPHAAEVSILRPESRYHRLVFTVPEWDAFLADVKAGLYDAVARR
jgi:hypothetical protein